MGDAMGEPILTEGWWWKAFPLIAFFGGSLLVNKACSVYNDYQFSCRGLVGDITKASEKDSATTGVRLLDIVEIKDGAKTDKLLECSGLGIWSDSSKVPIRYKHYEEYGKWWVSYESDPS